MIRPCGERVCNFKIQKSSLCSNRLRIFTSDDELLQTSSMIVNLVWAWNYNLVFDNAYHKVDQLFSKHDFYVFILSLSCIQIFQHIVIFCKGNITSDKLRSCFYKWPMSDLKGVFVKGTLKDWVSFELFAT